MFVVPTLASVVVFVVHVSAGNELLAEDAFATVGLFNVLFMHGARFRQKFAPEGAIGSYACSQHVGD
jgi:hypothetical protein